MKLTQAQVNLIFETIIETQEYDLTALLGLELDDIRCELEKPYQNFQKANEELIRKFNPKAREDKYDFGSPEKLKEFLEEQKRLLERGREYNIKEIPRNLLLEQGKLPGKFTFNLRPIIEKNLDKKG